MPDPEMEATGQPKPRKAKRTPAELLAAATSRPVLDPEEMAAYCGIGTSTAYRLLARGIVPAIRIPGTSILRVRREALDVVLQKWEQAGRRGRSVAPTADLEQRRMQRAVRITRSA